MSERLGRTLAAMDVGLQSSDERGYPDRADDPSRCARCLREERSEQGDLCTKCRQYLLGDSDVDPSRSGWRWHTEDGMVSGYVASLVERVVQRTDAPDQSRIAPDPAWVAHVGHLQRVRFMSLGRDGRPYGESNELAGYAVHHRDGNPRNNDIANLEIVPAAENVDRASHDAFLAEREQALQRLAEGLSVPPELLGSSRGVYDWAREEGARVAVERQRDWQAEAWSHSERIGWEFEAMARRYEERAR